MNDYKSRNNFQYLFFLFAPEKVLFISLTMDLKEFQIILNSLADRVIQATSRTNFEDSIRDQRRSEIAFSASKVS